MKRLEIPTVTMRELFQQGKRYDVLASWGEVLSEVDTSTYISREVYDEEILAHGEHKHFPEDPTGSYLLRRFRTHQLISRIMRGASQLGYTRIDFPTETYASGPR